MKRLILAICVLSMIFSVPAFATGNGNNGNNGNQDHTCQGGHNCNEGSGGDVTSTNTNSNTNSASGSSNSSSNN